jgi:DNA polymerase-3 subunit alpha
MNRFIHLHCHSHYSLLDGAATVESLVARAKELSMDSLALTDHGNLFGAMEFYCKAKEAGIKPILGYEAYVARGSRKDKKSDFGRASSYHLTLLAMNNVGWKNLIQLSSKASLEGFYRKPRIDRELIEEHNEGIICLSGCMGSELSRVLQADNFDGAVDVVEWYRKIFGDRYYIEIQATGLEIQHKIAVNAREVAIAIGNPMVATSDCHYAKPEDASAQDALLCVNTGAKLTDQDRFRMNGPYHMRSIDEMQKAFLQFGDELLDVVDFAIAETGNIADRCNVELEVGIRHFPVYNKDDKKSSETLLREHCDFTLRKMGLASEMYLGRMRCELDVICKLRFADYFLIVWDITQFCKENGILCSARGSGVGSLVCYVLGISYVDPIEQGLLFERFLDGKRIEAPDIDLDIDKERRSDVMQYVRNKYGHDSVAQICTFGTLAARAAVKDAGRVLGVPLKSVNDMASKVPTIPFAKLDDAHGLLMQARVDGCAKEVLGLAKQLEGLCKSVGTHAAGVVIGDRPLTEYVPLQRGKEDGDVLTQWAMDDVEKAGLLKMDFLGLRNLTVISRAVQLIQRTTGKAFDPFDLHLNDANAYELLCRGETKGVFQLEGDGISELLRRMKPDCFNDIIATVSLYRPGPLKGGMVDEYINVKHGRKQAVYIHPVMKEVLEETHGVMVYQEQIMRIMHQLGGIQLSQAYTCIKAISKQKLKDIEKYRVDFIAGSVQNGINQHEAEHIFKMIEEFAGYGFNKSHGTAYALIAYVTACLKVYYPTEFMAALLSSDIQNRNYKTKDAVVIHMEDCRRMGIEIDPPDVNKSSVEFIPADGRIRFALSAIKGCNPVAAEEINRQTMVNKYKSMDDMCRRVNPRCVTKATLKALINAGAMDSFGEPRAQMLATIDGSYKSGKKYAADVARGQLMLFSDDELEECSAGPRVKVAEFDPDDKMTREKSTLGFYLSGHPADKYAEILKHFKPYKVCDACNLPDKAQAIVGGVVDGIKTRFLKRSKPGRPSKYAFFNIDDGTGIIKCIAWPECWQTIEETVFEGAGLFVAGHIDKIDEYGTSLVVTQVAPVPEEIKK